MIVLLVLVATAAALILIDRFNSSIELRTSNDLKYLVFHEPTIRDVLAYVGHLGVDSKGCVYFELDHGGVRYLAAFRDGTEVSATGVLARTGRFYEFGDEVAVGRTYDPHLDTLDQGSLPRCEAPYDVFGIGF